MPKKDQTSSPAKPRSIGNGSSNGSTIRLISDGTASATVSLLKEEMRKKQLKKKKKKKADGDDDDIDDFPFFAPSSSKMQSQRASPPRLGHAPMSPRLTDPNAMSQRAELPALGITMTTSSAVSKECGNEKKQSKGIPKSALSPRMPVVSPPISTSATTPHFRPCGLPPSPPNEHDPSEPPCSPGPRRSSSQDGNFFRKVKKGKEQVHAGGLKAASFLDKVSHVAWDKLKSPRLNPKQLPGRSSSPHGSRDRHDHHRDASNDVDVFGMDLKEAVIRTRIVRDRKMAGDAAFWIPAIAYRCLQYLNVYGPPELGIYRIPGSTSVVDDLKAEFKVKHDVDLFENPPDDIHTVSSLLKGWLRSLPEAILPMDVQKRIYDKCKGEMESKRPPQAFIDELSNLPPYNYYLLNHLFSHLSSVCLASDVNKMNLSNLGMIFCSTLRIDSFCFNWLVNSWAECWAGCLMEDDEYNRPLLLRTSSDTASTYHTPQILSSESRASSRSGRPTEPAGAHERWPSASSREQHTPSPLQRGEERPSSCGRDRSHQREKMERAEEKEKEREKEREVVLQMRRHRKEPSMLSVRTDTTTDDILDRYAERYSIIEAPAPPASCGGGGGGGHVGECGRLAAPVSLPPIQPLSPMMKEGQNVV